MSNSLTRLRTVFLLLLLHAAFFVQGQMTIIFNAAAHGKDLKSLSFVQIISAFPVAQTARMEIDVKNLSGNGHFLKLTIPSLHINPGSNILPASRLLSAAIRYGSSEEGNYLRQTGMMPEGELEFCFRLVIESKNNPDEIFENCFEGTNILSSPLELVTPDNGDVSCEKRPTFSWQPPMPLSAGMTYQLKLVKVEQGQSAAEAVLINNPVIYQSNIRGFRLPFPSVTPDLKENQPYAWQVVASDRSRKSLSEIWTFTIECEKALKDSGSYRELKAEDDGGFLSTGSSLRFAIDNHYIEGPLQYAISDLGDPKKPFKSLPGIRLQKGSNHITIDLNKVPGMEEDSEYLLSVVMPDGKKLSLRFKYTEE